MEPNSWDRIYSLMSLNITRFNQGETPAQLLAEYGIDADEVTAGYVGDGVPIEHMKYILGAMLLGLQLRQCDDDEWVPGLA